MPLVDVDGTSYLLLTRSSQESPNRISGSKSPTSRTKKLSSSVRWTCWLRES